MARFLDSRSAEFARVRLEDAQYRCISTKVVVGHPAGGVAKALIMDLPRGQMNPDQMVLSAQMLFGCARDFITTGPLVEDFDLVPATAPCVADLLAHNPGLVPEAAAVMFARADPKGASGIQALITHCEEQAPSA